MPAMRFLGMLTAVVTVALVLVAPLLAQVDDDTVGGANIPPLPEKGPVAEYALAVLFPLAALALGLFGSRRSAD